MFKPMHALTLAYFFCLLTHAQTPAQTGDLRGKVNNLMSTHIGVETAIPPGWSIKAIPVSVARGQGDTVVAQFHIAVQGPPPGTLFEKQVIPVGDDKPTTTLEGISIGKDGILECAGKLPTQCGDPSKPDDPIEFTAQSIKGEPLRFLFASSAGTIGIVVVPYPAAARDHGCALSAVRLTPGFELALITGSGFPPNTDVHYTTSPDGAGEQTVRPDGRGVFRFALIPHVKPGQTSGTLKVDVKAPSCSPELAYDFGPK